MRDLSLQRGQLDLIFMIKWEEGRILRGIILICSYVVFVGWAEGNWAFGVELEDPPRDHVQVQLPLCVNREASRSRVKVSNVLGHCHTVCADRLAR